MKPDIIPTGIRLAFRSEGTWWNCYIADTASMEKAFLLASVRLATVQTQQAKKAFMEAMRIAFASVQEYPSALVWDEPVAAPEAERSGHA